MKNLLQQAHGPAKGATLRKGHAMAKSSGKQPPGERAPRKSNMMQFIMESIESIPAARGVEPINHVPYVDICSTETELIVEAEMPGMRQEDIEVTVYRNTLSIKALKYECFEETNVNYVCMERSFGKVFRSVDLPFAINTGGAKAAYKKGILRITLPRVTEKRGTPKTITIESN